MSNKSNENHHYVPKGVLKHFGIPNNNKKKNKNIYINFVSKKSFYEINTPNLNGIACQGGLYDFKNKDESLERDYFGPIDDRIAKITKSLNTTNDLTEFDMSWKGDLATYVASQICRVPKILNTFKSLEKAFKEQVSKNSVTFGGNVNDYFLEYIKRNTELYKSILDNMDFTVLETSKDTYVIGDNPVLLFEENGSVITSGEYTSAIEAKIFMIPISDRKMLAFFRPEVKNKLNCYAEKNNHMQFVQSLEYIFSNNESLLENETKKYYDAVFHMIEKKKPSLLKDSGLIMGNPACIGDFEFRFEGQALEYLKSIA
jgi:hypothetical protein